MLWVSEYLGNLRYKKLGAKNKLIIPDEHDRFRPSLCLQLKLINFEWNLRK